MEDPLRVDWARFVSLPRCLKILGVWSLGFSPLDSTSGRDTKPKTTRDHDGVMSAFGKVFIEQAIVRIDWCLALKDIESITRTPPWILMRLISM